MPAISADAADTLKLVHELELLDAESIRLLEQLLTNRVDEELVNTLIGGKEALVAVTLFRVCQTTHSPHVLGYTLRFLADLVFVNHTLALQLGQQALYDKLGMNPAELFLTLVKSRSEDPGIADPALYLASIALRYGPYKANKQALQTFFAMAREKFAPDTLQVADVEFTVQACVQVARRKDLRQYFFEEGIVPYIPRLLTNIVSSDSASIIQAIYQTLLLTWLLSYEYEGIVELVHEKIIPHLHRVLQRVQKEKCVRVAIMILLNLVNAERKYVQYMLHPSMEEWVDSRIDVLGRLNQADHAATLRKGPSLVAEMVSVGMLKTLGQLCRRKFGDEDIALLVQQLDDALEHSMETLTSFSEYRGEVLSGILEWTPVHTNAKFWKENVTKFEENNYEVLYALKALIMDTHNDTTLAVACHDLGEVVRYHPTGRVLLTLPGMTGIKQRVLTLMSHSSPAVAKEALLCTQKIMVQRWEYIQQQN